MRFVFGPFSNQNCQMNMGSIFCFYGYADICAFRFVANVRSGHLQAGYTIVPISLFNVRTAVNRGTRWRSWLSHCATSRKVAGSIPDGVIGIFH